MTLRKLAWFGLGAALIASQVGCRCFHREHEQRYDRDHPYDHPRQYDLTAPSGPRPGFARPGSPEILQPEPLAPGGAPALPAPGARSGFGAYTPPDPTVPTPRDLLPPTNVPVDARYYSPPRFIDRSEPPLAPVNPFPKSDRSADPLPTAPRLLPPDLIDPQASAKVPLPSDPITSPALPVGIDAFVEVMDRVSNGLRPDPEGLDWLQTNGYKTVIHLRRPGTPHTADKDQIEKRGMKYLSLEVSSETLTASLAAEFSRAVADRSSRPLFVYDKDGTLAGAMWYAYLRSVEKLPPADAKARATALGLKAADTGDHAALWSAAQKGTQE